LVADPVPYELNQPLILIRYEDTVRIFFFFPPPSSLKPYPLLFKSAVVVLTQESPSQPLLGTYIAFPPRRPRKRQLFFLSLRVKTSPPPPPQTPPPPPPPPPPPNTIVLSSRYSHSFPRGGVFFFLFFLKIGPTSSLLLMVKLSHMSKEQSFPFLSFTNPTF